jgi:branched-chain amino acid transport system ATP-binding protein
MTLTAEDLEVAYGRAPVLHGVSLRVDPGRIVSLLGGNAAGKSTTLKAIIGLLAPSRGRIELDGRRIDGWPPDRVVAAGVAMVPENRRLFPRLTVRQNLELGAFAVAERRAIAARVAEVCARLPFVGTVLARIAGTLSGGEQQQVAVARALMSRPRYLLMDEPSMGLAPALVERSFALLGELRAAGLGLLVVEQNTEAALAVSDRAYILRDGRVTLEGPSAELRHDPRVRTAFLGVDEPPPREEAVSQSTVVPHGTKGDRDAG